MLKTATTILCLCYFTLISAEDPGLPGKREHKEIASLFGKDSNFRMVQFPDSSAELQPFLVEGDAVFEIVSEERVRGYLLSTRAKGRFEYFDYSVIFSEDLTVLSMMVIVYRSTYGTGICSKSWLRQFVGYSGGNLELGKDIDAVSGASYSASSLVKDAERCFQLMVALRNTGLLIR